MSSSKICMHGLDATVEKIWVRKYWIFNGQQFGAQKTMYDVTPSDPRDLMA